jgi:Domain of unknown function (DUF6504)
MTRHIGESVQVQRHHGQLIAFTWRDTTYPVCVIDMWWLATRWWEPGEAADRTYYRVETSDYQIFELYYEAAPSASTPDNKRWVLDVCQD